MSLSQAAHRFPGCSADRWHCSFPKPPPTLLMCDVSRLQGLELSQKLPRALSIVSIAIKLPRPKEERNRRAETVWESELRISPWLAQFPDWVIYRLGC